MKYVRPLVMQGAIFGGGQGQWFGSKTWEGTLVELQST